MVYSRRDALRVGAAAAGALALGPSPLRALMTLFQEAQLQRTIPSTGEVVPVVGLGTDNTFAQAARVFDQHAELYEVLRLFTQLGGTVIDTAPTYDDAERVLSQLTGDIGNRDDIFWAAKISIRASGGADAGEIQVEQSFDRFEDIALEQIHEMLRWQFQLPMLQDLKQEGRIRYVGLTTSKDENDEILEEALQTENVDFVNLDYAIDNRDADDRLIPLARDRGVAVMVNSPFSRGGLFQRVGNRQVPEWAQAFGAQTWAQFFLKWVLGNEDVTVVVPGTSKPEHLEDNMRAGVGRLPNSEQRNRMARFIDALPA